MPEPYERALEIWWEMTGRWVRELFPSLAEYYRATAKGERGVLVFALDTEAMREMLAPPTWTGTLAPRWFSVDDFIESVEGSVGHDAAQRWAETLQGLDPRRDVAIYLTSTMASGGIFSRFLVTHDGSVPVQ